MKKSMCITYEVAGALYLNITNACTNSCDFCIRNNGDGAYGSDPLWLEHEPSYDEVIAAINSTDLASYPEVVFCGYGEPTARLDLVLDVARYIRKKAPDLPIRINTNGHASLIAKCDRAKDFEGLFDVVSISLNTPSAEKYVEMCHPVYQKEGFYGLLEFAKNVKKYVHSVLLSVVRETLTEEELDECYKIADDLGVTLKVRTYIGPDDK